MENNYVKKKKKKKKKTGCVALAFSAVQAS